MERLCSGAVVDKAIISKTDVVVAERQAGLVLVVLSLL